MTAASNSEARKRQAERRADPRGGAMSDRETLAAFAKDAFYSARDNGGTMHTAADDTADAILASDWLAAHDAELVAATRRQVLGEAVKAILAMPWTETARNDLLALLANLRDGGDT